MPLAGEQRGNLIEWDTPAHLPDHSAGLRHLEAEKTVTLAILSRASLEKAHQYPALLVIGPYRESRNDIIRRN